MIAITFDDGPSNVTSRLLDGLKARDAKATFFMLGSCAQYYPNTVRRAYEEGHQICSHTYDHPTLTTKTNEQIAWQLNKTDAILDGILGMDFDYIIRPPYGDRNDRVRSQLNSPSIIWSVDPYDWQDRNAQTVCNRIVSGSFDGAIVLVHDIYGSSVTGVLMAIDILKDYGYEFVTLNELYRRRGVAMVDGADYYYCRPNGTDSGAVTEPLITVSDTYGAQEVTITAQAGADIYYTTDGSNPIYGKQKYTGSFTISADTTVKAVAAFDLNGSRSEVVSLAVKKKTVAAPTITVDGEGISFINPNEGTDLRYSTDGTATNAESSLYTEPIPFFDGQLRYRVMGMGINGREETIYVTENGNLFRDVPTNAWYASTVDRAVCLGLFKGVGNYRFAPEQGVTRAMFVTVLYRLMQTQGADVSYETAASFPDAEKQWYADALSWGSENDIIKGYNDGTFRPDQQITREEMCVMLARALQWYGLTIPEGTTDFSDSDKISVWAKADVIGMTALEIVCGYTDASFRPQNTATRAEAATVLLRAYDFLHSSASD